MKGKNKTEKYLFVVFFLLALLLPLALLNTESESQSDFDNRMLAEFPVIDDPKFEASVESYFQDRIGLRNQIVTGYQLLNSTLTGELLHPIYTYGKDGYVFFNMHNNIEFGDYHQTFVNAVIKMRDYCEARNTQFYFMFDPEKLSVYRKYLPDGVIYDDEWVDILIHQLEESNVKCVNNKTLLIDLSEEKQVFNRQYDAGHWNDLGCFYGTNNLWKKMHEDFPAVTEYDKEDFEITTKNSDYLAQSYFPVKETVPVYTLRSKWRNITQEYADLQLDPGYQYFQYYVNEEEDADKYPKILVFHGSYYNRNPQFLLGRAKEYIGVHDYQNVLDLDYYYNLFQPEAVVFEAAEYVFNDSFFDSQIMAKLDYNPTLKADSHDVQNVTIANENIYSNVHGGIESVFYERQLNSARYVYLLSENYTFDMTEDIQGYYNTDIPKGLLNNNAAIIYENYQGTKEYIPVNVNKSQEFVRGIEYTRGAHYNTKSNEYILKTSLEGNEFNAINVQLFDAITSEYLGLLLVTKDEGFYIDSFIHHHKTGWYKIRLKANSNMMDEGIDIYAYLTQGQRYFYYFLISELTPEKAAIQQYHFYGNCPWQLDEKELLAEANFSEGADAISDESVHFSSAIDGNRFSSVVMNLIDAQTGEILDPFSIETETGSHNGHYLHQYPSGMYILKVRGNTNMQDAYITYDVFLKEGTMYEWEYIIENLKPTDIIISNISFMSMWQ